ncbi:MAG: hypothetical protein EXX96DRAFT_606487 [Benjaminiella poitrasii]|nr:MAG: hypothetical protein EXX96DRAFT_606487 [Benjaminiella poitrasii]
MSGRLTDNPQSSTSNNNRIEPTFFGSSSRYQFQQNKKKPDTTSDASAPSENPYWNNPPPPYSISPTTVSSDPSAPPLEAPFLSSAAVNNANTIYPPLSYNQQQQQQQPYSVSGYPQYGTINTQLHPNNQQNPNNFEPNNSWPWRVAPPSTNAPLQPHQRPPHTPPKSQKSVFKTLIEIIFYMFCVYLIYQVFSSIYFNRGYGRDLCLHGVVWDDFPKRFNYDGHGLSIRVVGGSLLGGRITLKRMSDKDREDENVAIGMGLVKSTALIAPASLTKNPELQYTLRTDVNGSTLLEIHVPNNLLTTRSCVHLETVIYVPDERIESLQVQAQNAHIEVLNPNGRLQVDHLLLTSTNTPISFDAEWDGKTIELKTSNSPIVLGRSLGSFSSDSILVSTTNGLLKIGKSVKAASLVSLSTTNAAIEIDDSIETEKTIKAFTTNGHINIDKIIADRAEIKSTNSRVHLKHANITSSLSVHTTNGPLRLQMKDGNHAEVVARTSNDEIYLHMPSAFEGPFEMKTSRTNKVELVDRFKWTILKYIDNGLLMGDRYRPVYQRSSDTASGYGHLQVETTNGHVFVLFSQDK